MTPQQELALLAEWLGIEVSFYPDGVCRDVTGFHPAQNIFAAKEWNPLTNDTEFLNRVAKNQVHIEWFPDYVLAYRETGKPVCEMFKDHPNKLAAMKHAAYQVCLMAAKEWKDHTQPQEAAR